jgi:hypothetical protein
VNFGTFDSGNLMRRKVKQSEQSKRRQNLVERAIWWIATKPWMKSATGYTKAYHVAGDIDEFDAVIRWFNDAADVIDQHYGKGYLGLRLEWGFVQRGGEEVKAIRVREWPGGKWPWLLDHLADSNQALTRKPRLPLSEEERALRIAARDKINRAMNLIKASRKPEAPDAFAADQRLNYRPDAPPETGRESYGPEDWKLMSDFLFMIRIPEKAFEYQAKAYDGWWIGKAARRSLFKILEAGLPRFHKDRMKWTTMRWAAVSAAYTSAFARHLLMRVHSSPMSICIN